MDNISQQADEIEALKSIFEDQWHFNSEAGSYCIQITRDVELWITLNPEYPSDLPPTHELLAPTLSKSQKDLVDQEFKTIFEERGSPIIYQWIEKLKEITLETSENNYELPDQITSASFQSDEEHNVDNKHVSEVIHGPIIVDRKSTFQGHMCSIKNQKQFRQFLEYLLENKKIAQATHNIWAYRVLSDKSIIQDCDDDGETHAGGRLLHLLEILELKNVAVVVSRWYGGILLGPDRFKHINNAARQALIEGGFLPSKAK
ncbi:protein IMPACT-B-like isoform X2 [Cylas formicarius]|uniref:protein IMPACT-B-like isoform X2 n=1 Tax=Cylas formicarius TaxID=197179 RepID=UPI00295887CA|nr:protein IMPACT-B-like isoform X2 [Cylas formicarius]